MAEKFYSFKSYKSFNVTTLRFMRYSRKDFPISREIEWIQSSNDSLYRTLFSSQSFDYTQI